jgi:ribonuclease HII
MLIELERELFNKGIRYIAGVDEVGRGPLAGPMVIGAVILDIGKILNRNYDVSFEKLYEKINDSKKVTEKNRIELAKFIKENCLAFSIIEISHTELDLTGISKSTQKAFFESIKNLKVLPQHIFTDAFPIKSISKEKQTNIIKGDSRSISIAAASIIAKVYRDDLMTSYAERYPEYGFEKHKGYGTKLHKEAIYKYGPCEIHRKSFEPIKSLVRDKLTTNKRDRY